MKSVILALLFAVPFTSSAVPTRAPSKAQTKKIIQHNRQTAILDAAKPSEGVLSVHRLPFAEYNRAGYLIMSANFPFQSGPVKKGIVKNLPEGVTVVIFVGANSKGTKDRIKKKFASLISEDRLKVIYLPGADGGFWARDGIPVPTVSEDSNQKLSLVDAKYYHNFEPDERVAKFFKGELLNHDYYFEGGNFMANGLGTCLVIDNDRVQDIPNSIFSEKYGCRKLVRLPHVKGIGHADESVKFIDDKTVLTDTESYVPVLEKEGFKVVMLPTPNGRYETYVNSLIIEKKVFLPVFDEEKDQDAIRVYEGLGFEVIPLNTESLSNDGLGSIHCITMTYPPGPFDELLKKIGAQDL